MKTVCFSLLLVLASIFPSYAQQRKAYVVCDSVAEIGDIIRLSVHAQGTDVSNIKFPLFPDSLDKAFEFFPEDYKMDTLYDAKTQSWTYIQNHSFSIYKEGSFSFPSLELGFYHPSDTNPELLSTQAINLRITAPEVDTAANIKDIKPILSAPISFLEVLPYALAALLLIGIIIGIFLYRKYKKDNKNPFSFRVKAAIPPFELAMQNLDILWNKKLCQQGFVKEYYTELTDILRKYIYDCLQIQATEMTTDELTEAFEEKTSNDMYRQSLFEVLNIADLVKFAKARPISYEHEKAFRICKDLIEELHNNYEQKTQEDHV